MLDGARAVGVMVTSRMIWAVKRPQALGGFDADGAEAEAGPSAYGEG